MQKRAIQDIVLPRTKSRQSSVPQSDARQNGSLATPQIPVAQNSNHTSGSPDRTQSPTPSIPVFVNPRHTNTTHQVYQEDDEEILEPSKVNERNSPQSDKEHPSRIPTLEYRQHRPIPADPHHPITEHPKRIAKPLYISAGIIAAVAIIAFITPAFTGATVSITPKRQILAVDQQFEASKAPIDTELGYSIMEIPVSIQKELPATGSRAVTAKAMGKIEIYNEFGTQSQRLIKNTRFQGSNGLIYKINESINVPGTLSSQGKITPGHIEATVYADEPGTKWNSAPMDFTIPGLKGDPRFTKIYARSKGEITGGASGQIRTVSDSDLATAQTELQASLKEQISSQVRSNLYAGQIVYDSSISSSIEDVQVKESPEGVDTIVVSQQGKVYAVVFDIESLAKEVARKLDTNYDGGAVSVANLSELTFSMSDIDRKQLNELDRVTFKLSGDADLRFLIDKNKIKTSLAGTPKNLFNQTLQSFEGIEKASATVSPFWQRNFPTNLEKIEVNMEETQK